MSKAQQFVCILAALIMGVALVVAGAVMKDQAMALAGTGLIGLFTGAFAIKRPKDI